MKNFQEHDYFYDTQDIWVLKDKTQGGLPKLAEMGGVQGLAEAFRTSLTTGLHEDEINSEFGLTARRERYGHILFSYGAAGIVRDPGC